VAKKPDRSYSEINKKINKKRKIKQPTLPYLFYIQRCRAGQSRQKLLPKVKRRHLITNLKTLKEK
jgi:hypothetical protein